MHFDISFDSIQCNYYILFRCIEQNFHELFIYFKQFESRKLNLKG